LDGTPELFFNKGNIMNHTSNVIVKPIDSLALSSAKTDIGESSINNNEFRSPALSEKPSNDLERFVLFKFQSSLSKGIKNLIKSKGCQWNYVFQAWVASLQNQKAVEEVLLKNNIAYKIREIAAPNSIIPKDNKTANLQTCSEILLKKILNDGNELLIDICRYDSSLRPEDFKNPPSLEGKTQIQIQFENDFHKRFLDLEKQKEKQKSIHQILSDQSEKILSIDRPVDNAKFLIQECFSEQGVRTLYFCSNSFWQWGGVKYIEVDPNKIRQIVYTFLEDAKVLTKDGSLKNFNPNSNKVSEIIDALKAKCFLEFHPSGGAIWLDGRETPNSKRIIFFQNGILSIDDWLTNEKATLLPSTPYLFNTNCLDFDFDPAASKPKEWLNFLEALWLGDIESQNTIQEWIGYLLTQDTKYQKILLIIGPPRAGKGTIGRIIEALLGVSNVVGPTLSSLSTEFGLQPLLNKTLIIISDVRLEGKNNYSIITERLLSISGEDLLTINRKYQNPVTVRLPVKIIMMSNELPDLTDSSGALANRYLILNLKTSWLNREDTGLLERLRMELPGILLWSLQGLKRLYENGRFIQPNNSLETMEELKELSSPIKAFVDEVCNFEPMTHISIKNMFFLWKKWCGSNGYPKGNIQSFGKSFKAAFPGILPKKLPDTEGRRVWCYIGVSSKTL
jgi:putative DNA primase/helicase